MNAPPTSATTDTAHATHPPAGVHNQTATTPPITISVPILRRNAFPREFRLHRNFMPAILPRFSGFLPPPPIPSLIPVTIIDSPGPFGPIRKGLARAAIHH